MENLDKLLCIFNVNFKSWAFDGEMFVAKSVNRFSFQHPEFRDCVNIFSKFADLIEIQNTMNSLTLCRRTVYHNARSYAISSAMSMYVNLTSLHYYSALA